MSSKAYSPAEREAVRNKLLETGLALYSKRGIRQVHLSDILDIVGISKPFFYKFFESVAEFVIAVLNFQWDLLGGLMDETAEKNDGAWHDRTMVYLQRLIHHRDHGLLVMTQEEEVWVRNRVSDELYDSFMARQMCYFTQLLNCWEIPLEKCGPKLLSNMIVSIVVTRNSGRRALPFLYLDQLEETAQAQAKSLLLYLESLKAKE